MKRPEEVDKPDADYTEQLNRILGENVVGQRYRDLLIKLQHKYIAIETENARLRSALERISDPDGYYEAKPHKALELVRIAREALKREGEK